MSTAIYPPRCPYRVATKVPKSLMLLLAASFLGITTTTKSLNAQELIDYRLVDPASHMQPWPEDEADILIEPPASIRVATKWRTNLMGKPKKSPRTETEPRVAANQSAPQADQTDVAPIPAKAAEVLAAPVEPTLPTKPQEKNAPPTKRDCYQAPSLATISTNIGTPAGKLPDNVAALCAATQPPTGDARIYGGWPCTEHHWAATCMHHRPLYFEEINAERYGYTVSYALQPIISAARFFATIPALPYKMAVDRPCDCVYTLGHYRPGNCVPRRCNLLPLNFQAGAVETGVIAGLILLIP